MSVRSTAGRLVGLSLLTLATALTVVLVLLAQGAGSGDSTGTGTGTAPRTAPVSPPAPDTRVVAAPAAHVVVALGDSVPSGAVCGCEPYPEIYGSLLRKLTGARVTVENRAVSGLTTAGLLTQLQTPAVQEAVRRADVVEVEIGANDFNDHLEQVVQGRCREGGDDCVRNELDSLRARLTAVLTHVRALRESRPTTILVMGYWNVFQDGDVARRAYGAGGLQASLTLTRRANAVISSVSAAQGGHYVDLFTPFEEAGRDVTSLLAADGDHPDADGHELIARTLLAAGLPRTG